MLFINEATALFKLPLKIFNSLKRQLIHSNAFKETTCGTTVFLALTLYAPCSFAQQPAESRPVNEKIFDQQLVAVLRHLELSPPCSSVLEEIQSSNLPKEQQLSDIQIFSRTAGAALAIMIAKEYPDFQPRLQRVNDAMLQIADICKTHREYSYTDALEEALERGRTAAP